MLLANERPTIDRLMLNDLHCRFQVQLDANIYFHSVSADVMEIFIKSKL
jgi:hypothetical protein